MMMSSLEAQTEITEGSLVPRAGAAVKLQHFLPQEQASAGCFPGQISLLLSC